MQVKKLIAVLALSAGACASHAGPITAQDYQLMKASLDLCRTQFRIAARQSGDALKAQVEKAMQCSADAKNTAKETYDAAVKDMKNADAKAALKDYQIAVNTAIAGLVPNDGENDLRYLRRLQALDEKIDQAWQRLALEL
jgi:hypothetical protein